MRKKTAEKLLNLVKSNYQAIAADFNETRKKEIWPEIRESAEALKNGDRVLDIGCGNGRFLEACLDRGVNYLGVDNSPELIKAAEFNYPGYIFKVGDILNLEEATQEKYDYIYCLAVLQHIPGRELRVRALSEMLKKLKPGGEMVISVWNLWSGVWKKKNYRLLILKNWLLYLFKRDRLDFGDLIFPWKNAHGETISARYYHAFTRNELENLVKRTSGKIKEIRKDNYNYWLTIKN